MTSRMCVCLLAWDERMQENDKLEKRLHVKTPNVLFKFDLSKKVPRGRPWISSISY